jgi:predicted ABC-type sugar transport system permease subunit
MRKLPPSTDERRSLVGTIQHALHTEPGMVPLIVLIASIIIFGMLLGQRFFSPFALTLILQQVQIVGIVAAAQSLVILTAGIDLSVGAIAVLSSVIMGQFAFRYGLPPEIAVVCGWPAVQRSRRINGWLVAVMKLPPFIVTLGMWQIVLAANFLYSANETIRSQDIAAEAPAAAADRHARLQCRRRHLHLWRDLHDRAVACCCPMCSNTPRGGAMSMRWATIRRPRNCPASTSRRR